ncbi:MAG: hypothetical protein V1784_00620, partial [bacterium]
MRHSKLFCLLFCVLLACTAACAEEIPRAFGSGSSLSHSFPPPHLSRAQMPLFERGELTSTPYPFDQFDWTLTQLLYDADTTHPNYNPDILDAVPTGMLFYSTSDRAYISTFHTIFFSDDGGFTWENGDPNPIPTYSWHFRFVRRPNYIYGLAANSAIPSEANKDIIYIVNLNSTTYQGFVRRGIFTTPQSAVIDTSQKTVAYWLGHLVLPDLTRLSALGSWDGWALFRGRCTIPCDTDTTVLVDTTIWAESY